MLEILVVKTVFSTIFSTLLKLPKVFKTGDIVSVNYNLEYVFIVNSKFEIL